MDYIDAINNYLMQEIDLLKKLDVHKINNAINEIGAAFSRDGAIYIFGNGGSASTASHFMNDFNKGISEHRKKKFRFYCLNDNIPTILAVANDIGYDDIFRFQLDGRLCENDLVIGISGSGNSNNVIRAIQYAKDQKVRTIGITGFNGGKLIDLVDVSLNVPVMSMQLTEDVHMIFDHLMMSIFLQSK